MPHFHESLRALVEKAKALHRKERQITLESVALVGELERCKASANLGMTTESLAAFIELTPNQFWKRAQAARVIRLFPKTLGMVQAGETHVAHLALISPKITPANAEFLLEGIRNKSKRDIEGLLSRVTPDGRLLDREPDFELRLKVTATQMALFDRAREVLSHGGTIPSGTEIFVRALGDLLDKRDPLRKAKRAAIRREKSNAPSPGKEARKAPSEGPSPGKEGKTHRPAVPAAVRHEVWPRDAAQCTWLYEDKSRCPERIMLEMDHVGKMWCRGGQHTADVLTLRCRLHNQFAAEQALGVDFMGRARELGAR